MAGNQASPGSMPRIDRLPPYDEEAEKGVLGSALVDAERVLDLCIERGLTLEAFYVPAHRKLFEVLLEMHRTSRAVDLLTVGSRLRDLNLLEELGGQVEINRLVDSTPTAAHAEYYATIVHEKFILRTIIERSNKAIDACYSSEEDAEEVLGATEQSFYEVAHLQQSAVRPWPDLIKGAMEEIEEIYQQRKSVSGVSTGYKDMDDVLMGMQPTDILILAARPSMGKTSLALNIAEHVALGNTADKEARPVLVFSLEMSSEQLVKRMVCSHAGVSGHKLAKGFLSAENHGRLMSAADALRKAQIFIDDSPGLSALEVRSRARRMKRKHDIAFIVVDYLQLMNYPQYAKQGKQLETAAISGALKSMAKELKVPVLVLSQLSRAPETRDRLAIPKLSDLRDSGSIEQDADVVMLLRRPARYPDDPDHDDKRLAVVDLAKHRNGPTGEVKLNFEDELMRFTDRTEFHNAPAGGDFVPADMEEDVL